MRRKSVQLIMLLSVIFLCGIYSCYEPLGPERNNVYTNKMVVYPNSGNKVTIVDYTTFDVVQQIIVNIPDSLQIHRMCLSTNKDYFIFTGSTATPPFANYIISYNISKNSINNIFKTGLDSVGAPRITAAFLPEEPGLFYLYSQRVGLYAIDFLKKEMNMISNESRKNVGKHFYVSHDKKIIAILNKIITSEQSYSEVEFYDVLNGLNKTRLIVNENNEYSIYISDIAFSQNNKKIYLSIRLPQMRGVANYFGSYNLETKTLHKSSSIFPWSVNPYYLAYSSTRQEVYMVGAQDKFYIIDVSPKAYNVEAVVELTGKVPSPSRIVIRPDEDVAFVSCVYTDIVFVIDLKNRAILKKIHIERPYFMEFL